MSKVKKQGPERYIPQGAEIRDYPVAAEIAYCYQSPKGPVFIAYKGRQTKPAQRYAFRDAGCRDNFLAEYVNREAEREDAKRARKQTAHELVEGDIIVSVWVYDQTNATFYQVVRVSSDRSAVVRLILADVILEADHRMIGHSKPRRGDFDPLAKEKMRRATGLHTLSSGKRWFGGLHKWDGKPVRVSFYG